jgi:hypothetical protein
MTVLRLSTVVVLVRASLPEVRVAAKVARGGLHKTLLMVRRVSPVLGLFARQKIVLTSRTVKSSRDHHTG